MTPACPLPGSESDQALLAVVSEKLGGISWEELLRERLFVPLGMDTTTISMIADLEQLDMPMPYLKDGDEWRAVNRTFLK